MTTFQVIALAALGFLLLREARSWFASPTLNLGRAVRCSVWIGAGIAIAEPGLVQRIADLLGIGRGADAVLYLFALTFLWAALYFHARCLRLERGITALARHLAIRDAVRGAVRVGQEPGGVEPPPAGTSSEAG